MITSAKPITATLLVAMILFYPLLAQSENLIGRVVGITDGDTITLLDSDRTQYKIRLAGIDAPEKKQPYGQRSKQSLSALAFDKDLSIEWTKKDRYGRIVGKLIDKQGHDLDLEQIRIGMAWHYKKYEKEQSLADRKLYAEAEDAARAKGVGLWSDPDPMPPWVFRKMKHQSISE